MYDAQSRADYYSPALASDSTVFVNLLLIMYICGTAILGGESVGVCSSISEPGAHHLPNDFLCQRFNCTRSNQSSNRHSLRDMSFNTHAKESMSDKLTNRAVPLLTDTKNTVKRDTATTPSTLSASDWNGPNDPDNPHNWPRWLRIYHATTPGFFGFAVSVSYIETLLS